MRGVSTNAQEVRDRREGSAEAHREEATPASFGKLKPVSPVGKGAVLTEEVGNAAERVVEGPTGEHPGQYAPETLAGRSARERKSPAFFFWRQLPAASGSVAGCPSFRSPPKA